MRYSCILLLLLSLTSRANAEVQTQTVNYYDTDADVAFEGFWAYDLTKIGSSPAGVLVVHQWMGLTDYEKSRCRQLAELGYVAFALDIYGKDVRPTSPTEAGKQAGIFKADRDLFRHRLKLGLNQLLNLNKVVKSLADQPAVDAKQVVAIGYCFGGTGVIELARSGAEIAGVVSFHGGLDSQAPSAGENIKAKMLILHGADDPFVPAADIEAFKAELNAAEVDWQMVIYSGAVHSFTQPSAGNDNSRGAAYNERADQRSWKAMQVFFNELLGSHRED